jgi:hypothetical protein
MVIMVDAETEPVLMVNVALVAPAATVTLDGTVATEVSLLESATCAPPDGAGPLSVTVPVEEFPPVRVVGLSDSEDRETTGGGVEVGECSKSKTAGSPRPHNFRSACCSRTMQPLGVRRSLTQWNCP